ncbi:MAG: VOC family protein [Cryobacterium sp.]|nr:VOC family protein [Cryobacterium sp.]
MLDIKHAFSGFSVDDLAAAKEFYGRILGLVVAEGNMGNLELTLPGGQHIFVYPKRDHVPASYTILNFVVDDIDEAVDDLNAAGVKTAIYDDPNLRTDSKGIARGKAAGFGPDIAWFTDPAGNVLSVLTE